MNQNYPFQLYRTTGAWGWGVVLYFRRRLLAVLTCGNGSEHSGRHLSLLINIGRPDWAPCITLPLDRVALTNVIGRIRRAVQSSSTKPPKGMGF